MTRFFYAVAALALALPAFAAKHVWTGAASGNLSDPANWIGGSPAGDPEAELSFPDAAPRKALTNDIPSLTVRSIAVSAPGYTIGNQPIHVRAGGAIVDSTAGPSTISCDLVLEGGVTFMTGGTPTGSGDGLVIDGTISGIGPLLKSGSGALTFTGGSANTYTGNTVVTGGDLRLAKRAFTNAVPGDLTLGRGDYYDSGDVTTLSPEQIADTGHVHIGWGNVLYAAGIETIGPLEIERGGAIYTTADRAGWVNHYTGRVILGGDVTITGGRHQYAIVYLRGFFEMPVTRTFTFDDTLYPGGMQLQSLYGSTPMAGVIVRGATSETIHIAGGYTGPTLVENAAFTMANPSSDVTLRGGSFGGIAGSLTAHSGVVKGANLQGDLRIGAGATLSPEISSYSSLAPYVARGTVRLGGTLNVSVTSVPVVPGKTHHVIDNQGTRPILGTFANLPEGATIGGGMTASYAGADGNDFTITDTRRYRSSTGLTISGSRVRGSTITLEAQVQTNSANGWWTYGTGTVTFREGGTVIATTAIGEYGRATTAVTLNRTGSYTFSAHYPSTATLDGSEDTETIEVNPPPPVLTSVEPATVRAGDTVTVKAFGTNFFDGMRIVLNSSYLPTTFVSSTELHGTWVVPKYEVNASASVYVIAPNYSWTSSKTIQITGVPRPASPLSWESSAVRGTVTPGAQSVWLRGSWRGLPYSYRRETQYGEVLDSDHDGVVRWALPEPIPVDSKFLMIDVQTGTISAGMPNDKVPDQYPFDARFVRGTGGALSNVIFNPGAHDMMWVRPGAGAWRISGGGGPVSTSSAVPLYGTTPPPAGFERGDVVAVLKNAPDFWYGGLVDDYIRIGPGALLFSTSVATTVTEGDAVARLKVIRLIGADGTVSVNYTTVDDTALAGVHYEGRAGTLTFAEGELEKWIEIPVLDDSVYSGTTEFDVHLTDPVDATLGTITEVPVRIQDFDAKPTVAIGPDVTMEEGDGEPRQATFAVTLSSALRVPVTVHWTQIESYSYVNGESLVFAPGETQKTITISFRGNTVIGPDRSIGVNLSLASWNDPVVLDRSVAKLTIIEDDEFAGITILDTSVSEASRTATITIALSEYSERPVTVSYGTQSLTAFSGRDYERVRGKVTFNLRTTIEVPIVNDTLAEPEEAFLVILSDPISGRLVRSSAAVVIGDDDPNVPPTLSVDPVTVYERYRETAHARFLFKLSHPVSTYTSFWVRTVNGTATGGSDFNPMTFYGAWISPGQTSTVVDVWVSDDQLHEGTEWFRVEAFDENNSVLAHATATIYDDEGTLPLVTIENAEVFEGNDGVTVMRFVVRLTRPSLGPVTVMWQTADGTAGQTDFQAASGQVILEPQELSKTVMVNVTGDTTVEPDETFELRLTGALNAEVGKASATGTIRNDDHGPKDNRR